MSFPRRHVCASACLHQPRRRTNIGDFNSRLPPTDHEYIESHSVTSTFLKAVNMQDSSSTSSSIDHSPLFKLPRELRDNIYEYAVYSEDDDGICTVTRRRGIPEPPLLFTCNIIREEAVEVFYSVNIFRVNLLRDDLHPAAKLLLVRKQRALATKGLNTLKDRSITVFPIGYLDDLMTKVGKVVGFEYRLWLWLEYAHA